MRNIKKNMSKITKIILIIFSIIIAILLVILIIFLVLNHNQKTEIKQLEEIIKNFDYNIIEALKKLVDIIKSKKLI